MPNKTKQIGAGFIHKFFNFLLSLLKNIKFKGHSHTRTFTGVYLEIKKKK